MDWSLHGFNGILLLLENFSFSIDPISRGFEGDAIVISHAHGDHIAGFKSKKFKLASYQTFRLYEVIFNRRVENFHGFFMDGQRITLGGVDLEGYNSGHILGSLQFRFERFSSSIVYTGDLNLVDTIITCAGKILECDELIIDATYGSPNISFPDRSLIYEDLVNFVESSVKAGRPPVFKVYSIGKAQEIIALINKFLGWEVLVDSRISRINDVYRSFGINLKYVSLSSSEGAESFKSKSLPVVTSSYNVLKIASKLNMLKAVATGWSSIYRLNGFDASFPLSNHADFNQLISYVEKSKAKRVYPIGRFSRHFSNWIRKRMNIDSRIIQDFP